MHHPWNWGGINPSFYIIWGLSPPSPYVEPPLPYSKLTSGTGDVAAYAPKFHQVKIFMSSRRILTPQLAQSWPFMLQQSVSNIICADRHYYVVYVYANSCAHSHSHSRSQTHIQTHRQIHTHNI